MVYLSGDQERALLRPLLPQIAAALGDDWRAEFHEENPRWGYLVLTGGARLGDDQVAPGLKLDAAISTADRTPRLIVDPAVPRLDPYVSYDRQDLDKTRGMRASLDPNRPAAQLARDIRRRVVEPYAEVYPQILERHRQVRAKRSETLATAYELAALLGTALSPREIEELSRANASSRSITLYARERAHGLRVEIFPYGAYEFHLGSSDADAALDIAAALVELKEAGR